MMRRGRKTAKVAMARKLAVRLYRMICRRRDYQQWVKFGSHAGQPGHRAAEEPHDDGVPDCVRWHTAMQELPSAVFLSNCLELGSRRSP
jgi:hypothetical protein